ncbi:MAG TPA: HAMP domain-containing sensor histidine kinase [Candidatus Saccharimonadia bacterium]|nr:HAMP domain-containing sensor histidine kinase [Candidatus Saccharimonadia bacterium]
MLSEFLAHNRDELIRRCREKTQRRAAPRATEAEIEQGIPLFLTQLIGALRAERKASEAQPHGAPLLRLVTPEPSGSAIGGSASATGREMLTKGFTVSQVVHNYGDLCQSVTELASETGTLISAANFHTFNRCLDEAIADAVTAYAGHRDSIASERGERGERDSAERLGELAHELRNALNTAMLSFGVIKSGRVAIGGATSALVERSHFQLRDIIDRALAQVRLTADARPISADVEVDRFIADVEVSASLEAQSKDCAFSVEPVAPGLVVRVDRHLLDSAVSNLLQNAFKFSKPGGNVRLRARARGERILIEVEDECGGLAPGQEAVMFVPFAQQHANRTGIGLGLSIARRAIEANGGTLEVRSVPGVGCIFTIELPGHERRAERARAQ